MRLLLLLSFALVALVIGQEQIPLDEKIRLIFDNIDESDNELVTNDEVTIYFHFYKENTADDFVACLGDKYQTQWIHRYRDFPHIALGLCTEHFDSDGDGILKQNDWDAIFHNMDSNANLEVDFDEAYVYLKDAYNALGIFER